MDRPSAGNESAALLPGGPPVTRLEELDLLAAKIMLRKANSLEL